MKGSIVDAIKDLIVENFGIETWADILEGAGLGRADTFKISQDIPDEIVYKVINSISTKLDLTFDQIADLFGEYWAFVYTPKVYKPYHRRVRTAKEFLLKVDSIHQKVTKSIPNAHPPRIEYREEGPNVLIMKYISERKLIRILLGVVKGVGKRFDTDLTVEQISEDELKITFNE